MTDLVVVVVLGAAAGLGSAGLVGSMLPGTRRRMSSGMLAGSSPDRSVRGLGRYGPAVVLGAAAGALTGWPVGVLAGVVGGAAVGRSIGRSGPKDMTRRIEAVATWTELLRDTLIASAGLGQAIVASAKVAPPELEPEVGRLADRVVSGVGMSDALRAFAEDVSDPSADLVVCALVLATEARAQRLADLLSALAESTREEVSMRLRVESGRASARGSVRTILVFSLGFALLMVAVAGNYLSPFDGATGQLVLLAVVGSYGAGIWLMARLVRCRPAPRLLVTGVHS